MNYLPDVNFWLALTARRHEHHARAEHWIDEHASVTLFMVRLAQIGLLRLWTNSSVMATDVIKAHAAWKLMDGLLMDPRVIWASEPKSTDVLFRKHSEPLRHPNSGWNDSYFLALAEGLPARLLTFDRGLAKRAPDLVSVLS
jgi:uncharacterized protein